MPSMFPDRKSLDLERVLVAIDDAKLRNRVAIQLYYSGAEVHAADSNPAYQIFSRSPTFVVMDPANRTVKILDAADFVGAHVITLVDVNKINEDSILSCDNDLIFYTANSLTPLGNLSSFKQEILSRGYVSKE
ncbi:MAG: hypothetical protein EPN86_00045 [Nanoarchaeota archaeon]|nr:MAG: hypothetical protein EPN86_00045 [Nanoarchaeota archaeon]